jgi:hypothetical protein
LIPRGLTAAVELFGRMSTPETEISSCSVKRNEGRSRPSGRGSTRVHLITGGSTSMALATRTTYHDDSLRPKHRFRRVRAGAFTLLLSSVCSLAVSGAASGAQGHLHTERNSKLSYLLSRIVLKETAGSSNDTGQYFVKLFELPRGEECDVEGSQCEGFDLLISVSSLDLLGDKTLFQFGKLARWEFLGWSSYAEYDAAGYFTSFKVSVQTRDGKPLRECGHRESVERSVIKVEVNPWEIKCAYVDR